jgi:Fe2+ transport system protein FeoA
VRTYESPLDRRFEELGFANSANVSLLMKEVAERVAKPALVPAVLR